MAKRVSDIIGEAVRDSEQVETKVPVVPPPVEQVPDVPEVESGIPEDLIPAAVIEPPAPEKPAIDPALQQALDSEEPPKDGRVWGALRAALKEAEHKLKAMEADKTPKSEEMIAEYERKLKEKDELVSRVSLEHSETFQREYDQPIQTQLGQAQRLLQQHAGLAKEAAEGLVKQALRMSFADRNRFLQTEVPDLAGVLSTMFLQADEKIQTRHDALQQWQATNASLKESELRTRQVKAVSSVDVALTKAVDEVAASGNIFYKRSASDSPKAKAWNQAVDLRIQAVKQTLLQNKQEDIAKYVADGFSARELRAELARVSEMYKKLQEETKGLVAARPSVKGKEATAVGDGTPKTKQQIFQEAFAEFRA